MLQRRIYIVVALIFLLNGEFFAQEKNVENFWGNIGFQRENSQFKARFNKMLKSNPSTYFPPFSLTKGGYTASTVTKRPYLLRPDAYASQLSFFCRAEWQLEKRTSIPLRFRLGSLAYTDYLEQKPNAVRQP